MIVKKVYQVHADFLLQLPRQHAIRHYRGSVRSMRDIWKAAKSFDVDCYKLSERMLVQMLYTGAFVGEKMEIFRYYVLKQTPPYTSLMYSALYSSDSPFS